MGLTRDVEVPIDRWVHRAYFRGMSRIMLIILVVGAAFLWYTNPTEADFREHVRKETGIAGQFGMVFADLLSGGKEGGIKRDNYFLASRFYVGGDGILPRRDLAWGVGGKFFEIKEEGAEPVGR